MLYKKWQTYLEPFENTEEGKLYLNNLYKVVIKNRKLVCPSLNNVFRIFDLCTPEEIKVVILGQDPYHSIYKGQKVANGVAFGSHIEGFMPPSLKNISNQLEKTVGKGLESSDLDYLVEQGVFLMNTSWTVNIGKPGSHVYMWKDFTKEVLKIINKEAENREIISLLWGRHAQSFKEDLSNTTIIENSHPSPFSFNKTDKPFTDLDFSKINGIKWHR
jgi:uracil-DNA glycosylase